MKRRDFFSFITGLVAGSLLPWRREQKPRKLPIVWASDYRHPPWALGVDPARLQEAQDAATRTLMHVIDHSDAMINLHDPVWFHNGLSNNG